MAFNPFHRFRKHQKALLAVMAILCMFIFIGQFGRGDPISKLMQWLGMRSQKGQPVTTLYGEPITEVDLGELSFQRMWASQFIERTLDVGFDKVAQDVTASLRNVPYVGDLVTAHERSRSPNRTPGDKSPEAILKELDALLMARPGSGRVIPQSDLTPTVLAELNKFRALLRFEVWREPQMQKRQIASFYLQRGLTPPPQFFPDPFIFGGANSVRGLLDFKIWLHEADRLGIYLTDYQLRQAINREAAEKAVIRDSFTSDKFVTEFLASSNQPRLTADKLATAVMNEFRVLMAKEALLGELPGPRIVRGPMESTSDRETPNTPEAGVIVSPAAGTPEQFFEYYIKQTSMGNFGVMAINVKDYLSKVNAEPTEKEADAFFQKFKDREPFPEAGVIGFKEPMRARVQWVFADPTKSRYKERALIVLMHQAVLQKTISVAPPIGSGPLPWAITMGTALAAPDPLQREYDLYRKEQTEDRNRWLDTSFAGRLHDVSLSRPGPAVFGFGQLSTSTAGIGSAFAGPTAFIATASIYEKAEAVRILGSYMMAMGLTRMPSLNLGVGHAVQIVPYPLPVLPREQVQQRFLTKLEKDLAGEEMRKDLTQLDDLLAKAVKDPKLRGQVDELIDKLGLSQGIMEKPLNRFEIADDPALRPFRDAFMQKNLTDPFRDQRFAQLLLTGDQSADIRDVYSPATWTSEPQFGGLDSRAHPTYKFWQVERVPPRVPNSWREVREKVVLAWKLQEARRLARKDADRILADLKKQAMPGEAAAAHLKQLANQEGRRYFTLNGVAKLVAQSTSPLVPVTSGYKPYEIPRTEIPYPPANLLDLLSRIEKPGEAVVFLDQSEGQFYVAVLAQRTPNMDDSVARKEALRDFLRIYELGALGEGGNPLWRKNFVPEIRNQYQEQVMQQLRIDAAGPDNVDSAGELKLPRDVRLPDSRSNRGGQED
jgi:hypothetical protein